MPPVCRHPWALLLLPLLLASAARGAEPEQLPTPRPLTPTVVPGLNPGTCLPEWLPHYALDVRLDVAGHKACVRQRVTWTNRHARPASELVFNAHSHYQVPGSDVGLLAKTLEIMRMLPSEAMDLGPPPLEVTRVSAGDQALPFHYRPDNATALVVPLPRPVAQGESVSVEVEFTLHLPQKQGRWGQWRGVTFLSNWLPVLAFYDDHGWQPTPFIPWHQPFFNEAGVYNVRVTLPADQKIACSGSVVAEAELPGGMKQVDVVAPGVRDFAFLCSARFVEVCEQAGPVRVRCVAFPEHEFYAREIVRIAAEVVPVYGKWFGPYPWPELTFVESYFGWNGNECSTLVMIDERVFGMPHIATGFVEYLISHETCHQWWYNAVGTNGYAETWMDEALANYFAHRFLTGKHGRNSTLLHYPKGLEWLPNIPRDSYRYSGLYGTLGRGEACPTVQDMPKFGHVVTLFSMAYDKGGQVVGMIEDRLGPVAFLDFMSIVYRRYQFRVIRVADLQRELEEYTGRSWEEFFQRWLYGAGVTDWAVEKVEIRSEGEATGGCFLAALRGQCKGGPPYRVTVTLHQKADYDEQTVLGFCVAPGDDGKGGYQVRVPIIPQAQVLTLDDPPARVEPLPDHRVRVEVVLPWKPTQIAVDPDQVLVDKDPSNNFWKPPVRWRVTPVYTFMEETSLTSAYDRWNVIAGPWFWGAAYDDPWYTRSPMAGFRAGLYRTEHFAGGAYAAYRTDFRDVVAGADGTWSHWPLPAMQVGFNLEQRLATYYTADSDANRGSLFARYVFLYSPSLYLPPAHYVEAFANYEDNFLPFARNLMLTQEDGRQVSLVDRPMRTTGGGLHYKLNYLTPYWDPEGGFQLDATYAGGVAGFETDERFHELNGQLSVVKAVPDLSGWVDDVPILGAVAGPPLRWLGETRLAARAYGGAAVPTRGAFFTLGGSELFRGFDPRERQGSVVWVGSLEWRVPVVKRVNWDVCDHVVGVRNVYAAAFYDAGDAYVGRRSYGPVAHALGLGLRVDLAWLSFVEHTTLRFDVAQTINADTPVQFWFGLRHPF